MIRINLLPPGTEPSPVQFNPVYPVLIVGAIVGGFLFLSYRKEVNARDKQRDEIVRAKNEIKQLEPIIEQVEKLEAAKAQLSQKKGVIQGIESERLRYPMLMDDLVRLLPGNVWFSSVVTVLAGNAVNLTMQVSALDNYALADLVSNLESSQIFADTELGPVSAAAGTTGGQTLSFQLTTTYKKLNVTNNAIAKS